MKHSLLIEAVIVIAFVGLYLYLANYYIYFNIGAAGLKAVDKQHIYVIGDVPPGTKPLTYAALGDSFTSGVGVEQYEDAYPYLVAKKMGSERGVVLKDFSFPGAKTIDLVKYLLPPAIAAQPDIVTVLIGTNDIHGRVREAEFEKNYRYIIEQLQEKTDAKIYLVSVPFAGSDKIFLPPYDYYFRQKTLNFNKIIIRLAGTYKVGYIDIATPTEKSFKKDEPNYSDDSFHPCAAGYKLWAQIIYDNINR